jgi:lecithin-cholesterol acyltransferase
MLPSFLALAAVLLSCFADAHNVPFILIPGLTVPTLEAKFDIKSTPHVYCPKHSKDYEPVYLVTDDLLPGIRDCYISLMLMEVRARCNHFMLSIFFRHSLVIVVIPFIQEHNGHFSNASGVDIRVPGFGLLSSILYFKVLGKKIPVYLDFANNMTAAGWVLDVTARAAPYDWRYDPVTLMDTGYADQLQVSGCICARLYIVLTITFRALLKACLHSKTEARLR